MNLEEKEQRLEKLLKEMAPVVVAFSGGVDSSYLAWKAHQVLGPKALAVTAESASVVARSRFTCGSSSPSPKSRRPPQLRTPGLLPGPEQSIAGPQRGPERPGRRIGVARPGYYRRELISALADGGFCILICPHRVGLVGGRSLQRGAPALVYEAAIVAIRNSCMERTT